MLGKSEIAGSNRTLVLKFQRNKIVSSLLTHKNSIFRGASFKDKHAYYIITPTLVSFLRPYVLTSLGIDMDQKN